MAKAQTFKLDVPQQGISKSFAQETAIAFIKAEQQYFSEMQNLFAEGTNFLGQNYGNINLPNAAINQLNTVLQAIQKGTTSAWDDYVEKTRTLQLIVGQGEMGQKAKAALKDGDTLTARWIVLLYSASAIDHQIKHYIAPVIAMARASPANLMHVNIIASKQCATDAAAARATAEAVRDEFEEYRKEKELLIDALARRYREHITIEKPAEVWTKQFDAKTKQWQLWLSIFVVIVVATLGVLLYWHSEFANWVNGLSQNATGTLSLAGLATITLPALLYAWVLRSISRLFIQNLSLADDAMHRSVLATTYLGLVDNKEVGILPEERVLILNALFRPLPMSAPDEGPPSSLVEMITAKSKS